MTNMKINPRNVAVNPDFDVQRKMSDHKSFKLSNASATGILDEFLNANAPSVTIETAYSSPDKTTSGIVS